MAETAAANRWLAEVYDPVIASMPADLRGRLDDAEVFHEILEHRWFLSEAEGRDVGTSAAAADYFAGVLPAVPPDLTVGHRNAGHHRAVSRTSQQPSGPGIGTVMRCVALPGGSPPPCC